MRVLAGMCLIAAAVMNLIAAAGFLGGILVTGLVEGHSLENLKVGEGAKIFPEFSPLLRALSERGLSLELSMFTIGLGYAASAPFLIIGGTYLFLRRGLIWVLLACLLALAVEVADFGLGTFGLTNLFGIVGGLVGIPIGIQSALGGHGRGGPPAQPSQAAEPAVEVEPDGPGEPTTESRA
jgi:hypothetical protein